jgi:RND superfamily putative drug exporter
LSTQTVAPKHGVVARLAQWVVDHRRIVVVGWIALLVAISIVSAAAKPSYTQNFSLPKSDSQRAFDALDRDFPAKAGDSDQIVLHARHGAIADPAVKARVTAMLAAVAKLPHVDGVASPYDGHGNAAISRDGRTAFATVAFDHRANELPKAAAERVVATARAAGSADLQVELGGRAIEQTEQQSFGTASAIGMFAAIVVLLLTFGSLAAMGMPILTALVGLGTAFGFIGLLTHLLDTPDVATDLAAMVGLGVGIDYALFLVTRFRELHRDGASVDEAVVGAMDTAGRAVVFAGITVIVAVLGMCLLGIGFMTGMAIATVVGVLFVLLAALTILPAMLSRFGERIARLGRRQRKRAAANGGVLPEARGRSWASWARFVQRNPWPAMLAGLALVLALSVPALSLRMGQSDAGNGPTSQTTKRAYDLLAQGFGTGFNGPLLVVAELPRSGEQPALAKLAGALRRTPDVVRVSSPSLAPAGRTATVQVYPASAPQDAATTDLVHALRERTLPPVAQATGAHVFVGGVTAVGVDFASTLASKLPLFLGAIIALAALLLLVVFRSLVIPLQAAVMNLLSIGASLGLAVLIFQDGFLGGVLDVQKGPIDAFIPVMLFSIVFGLSMDYEVFLVSRIHEAWVKRRDASGAVVEGLATTGRVITAAATIMICVFLSFALNDDRGVKLFGVSFAIAVFVDAFVVRSLLLPATLQLLGRRTWWLPDALERRLPHLAIEPPETEAQDEDHAPQADGGARREPALEPAG